MKLSGNDRIVFDALKLAGNDGVTNSFLAALMSAKSERGRNTSAGLALSHLLKDGLAYCLITHDNRDGRWYHRAHGPRRETKCEGIALNVAGQVRLSRQTSEIPAYMEQRGGCEVKMLMLPTFIEDVIMINLTPRVGNVFQVAMVPGMNLEFSFGPEAQKLDPYQNLVRGLKCVEIVCANRKVYEVEMGEDWILAYQYFPQ